nr:MAG TPA: hypothetical protein [Myoviridae sp. ct3tv2]
MFKTSMLEFLSFCLFWIRGDSNAFFKEKQ